MSTSDAIGEKKDAQTPLEPLFVALEHIEARGSLLLFAPDHAQRVRLMKAMTETELVVWNAMVKRYQLTAFGLHRLAEYRGTTFAIEGSSLDNLGRRFKLDRARTDAGVVDHLLDCAEAPASSRKPLL